MIRVAVIGTGYWGPNLLRNLVRDPRCEVVVLADQDADRLRAIARMYPAGETSTDASAVIDREDIDAVVIATPLATHFAYASAALTAGKHVLVEKPMTTTVEEAEQLVSLAGTSDRVLMVDHTFVYSGAVRAIRDLIDAGELGVVHYFDSIRVHLGLVRSDANVLWDLGPHDLSILSHLLGQRPASVAAHGSRPVTREGWNEESIAYVNVTLDDGTLAHFSLNWISPVKIRRVLIGGSRRMVVYDHLDTDNQVKIYDADLDITSAPDVRAALSQIRLGDMVAPKVDQTEALQVACAHFLDCIEQGVEPLTGGAAGLENVRLLVAAQRSMDLGGTAIDL